MVDKIYQGKHQTTMPKDEHGQWVKGSQNLSYLMTHSFAHFFQLSYPNPLSTIGLEPHSKFCSKDLHHLDSQFHMPKIKKVLFNMDSYKSSAHTVSKPIFTSQLVSGPKLVTPVC